jgi:ribosomal-protein-alanine N-acetyltransferase
MGYDDAAVPAKPPATRKAEGRLVTHDPFAAFPRLATARLILRQPVPEDATDLHAALSDPEVTRYLPFGPRDTLSETQAYLAGVEGHFRDHTAIVWTIVRRDEQREGAAIGLAYFLHWSPEHARAEVGYLLARAVWGQGYATEALRALLAFSFEVAGCNRVEAWYQVENRASGRAMEKAGMRFEGVLREHQIANGRPISYAIYSMLGSEHERVREDEGA